MGAVADKLRIEITVDDKGTPVIQYFKGNAKAGLEDVTKAAAGSASGFSNLWKSMFTGQAAFAVVNAGFRGVKEGIAGTYREAVSFESGFANVTTLLANGSEITGELKQGMLDMAGSLGSATELTEGLYNALSAGVAPAEAVQFIGESAKFSRAALAGMYQSVDVLTTVLNAYGMKASEVTDVSDVLFQVINDGKVTGQQLASALGNVIPTAAAMGVNIREVGAAIAIMTQGGIGADEAVTALNQTLLSALSPTKDAEKMAKSLGIELSKAGIEGAGGLQKWLQQLKEKIGGNTEAMSILFPNVRALKSALSLAGEQSAKYAKEMEILKNVTGVTDDAFKKQEATMTAVTTAIKNEISAALIQLLLPALKTAREWLEKNKESIIEYGKKIMAFAGDVARLIGGAVGWFIKNRDAILAMGAAMTAVFVINKVQTWYKALDIAGSSLMTVIQRAQMLRAVGAGPIDAFTQSINYSFGAATTLTGALKNLPAVGLAAFAGWKIGELLDDLLGLSKRIQSVYDKLSHGQEYYNNLSAALRGVSEHTKTTAAAAGTIRELGAQLGVTSGGLLKNASAIKDNKEAFGKLSPEVQALVTKLALATTNMQKQSKAAEDLKVATDPAAEAARKFAAQQAAAAAAVELQKKAQEELAKKQKEAADIMEKYGLNQDVINSAGRELYFQLMQTVGILPVFTAETQEAAEWQQRLGTDVGELTEEGRQMYYALLQLTGILPNLSNGMSAADQKAKDLAADMKKYNDIQQFTGAIVSGITDVLGSLGYELTTTEQGFMDFGNSMMNLGVAVASGNIAGIIAGVAGAVAGLAKALFSHKETYGEFVIRIEEERKAAEAFRNSLVNLSDTISNMSAWTDTSFENYIGIMKDLVSEFGDGLAVVNGNVESAVASWAEQFGSAFTAIISKAQQAGQEGSASLIEMFELLESNGLRVAEVQDYINAKLESAADAYADLKDMIDSSTVAQEVFGNISVPILDEILAYRQKVAENKDLVDSIGAATRMMVDFTDSTRINQGQFDRFSQSAVKSFDALKAGGMDGSQALQAMGPYLQRLQFMHEQYGFTIDANTQKILDQAIKEGKVVENKKTDTQQIIDLLGVIAKQLGGDIPDALGETSKAATGAFKDASKAAGQFNTELDKLGNPRNIYVSTKKQGDYEIPAASGGQWYVPGGSYTRFVTGEDEDELVTVTPKSKLRGGYVPGLDSPSRSGSDSASMTVTKQYRFDITINGVTSPEIVADHMNVAIERNVRGVRSKIEAL